MPPIKRREPKCIACEGTGVSSKGTMCFPCKGTGKGPTDEPRRPSAKEGNQISTKAPGKPPASKTPNSSPPKHPKTAARGKPKKHFRY